MKEIAIRENHLYAKVYAKGRKYVTGTVCVYVLPDYKAGKLRKENPLKVAVNRVGLTASKKTGNAVVRNRCKRVLREAYRGCDRKTGVKRGFLIVLVAREKTAEVKSYVVEKDMAACFTALNLFRGMGDVFPKKPKNGPPRKKTES